MIELNSKTVNLFKMVAAAAFSNPFSPERLKLDYKIAGLPDSFKWDDILFKILSDIRFEIDVLKSKDSADIPLFIASQNKTVEIVFLFYIFHEYINDFDVLINQQICSSKPVEVFFADKIIKDLSDLGFDDNSIDKYISLFFQMRRAYYFIENNLIGESESIVKLRVNLWNNIFTNNIQCYIENLLDKLEDFSTLLLGETGTGKGSAAAAIGRSGFIPYNRKKNIFESSFTENFIEINLSQYSESLIESELFGHRKGAFTGAVEDHKGIFERCSMHGAIFLDEIGEVNVPIQIKLLNVLQNRNFVSVGDHKRKNFRGRVIAATNKSIDDLRLNGKFRDDFYYRLCSDIIYVPTLQQRIIENKDELDILINHCIKNLTGTTENNDELYNNIKNIINNSLQKNYRWPGNVRELEQCIRRIILKGYYEGDSILLKKSGKEDIHNLIENENVTANNLIAMYCKKLYSKYNSYEEVARITAMDRRTVKKYIEM